MFHIGVSHRLLGELALRTEPEKAATHFEHSIARLRALNAEHEQALARAGYGRLLAGQGHIWKARAHLTAALGILDRLGILGEPDQVRRDLATLPSEPGDPGAGPQAT